MIRKLLTAIMLCGFSGALQGQYNALMLTEPDSFRITLQGQMLAGSGSITNKIYNDFNQGGYLSSDQISTVKSALARENLLGSCFSTHLTALFPLGRYSSQDSVYGIADIGYHQIQEIRFSREAALLALNGNLAYEGKKVELGQLDYQFAKYHQWKLGMMKVSRTERGTFYAGFAFGVSLGIQQMDIHAQDVSLYTAPYGEYLSLYTNMSFSRSAPEGVKPFRIQGAGPALDFYYAWIPDKGTSVALSFTQLGFIMWNDRSYSYSRDTTFLYQGIVADNIFMMEEGWEKGLSTDTLNEWFNLHGVPHSHYTSLPLTLHLSVQHKLSPYPFVLHGEILYRHQTLMKPYVSFSLEWILNKRFSISRTYAFGGYSRYSSGFAMAINLSPGWNIRLGSNAIVPSFEPSSLFHWQFSGAVTYSPGSHAKTSNL